MGLINWFKNAQEQHEKDLKERNKKFEETKQKLENEKLKTQAEIAEHKKRIEENKAKLAAKKANKTSANSNSVPKSNALTVKVTGTNYRNQKEILSLGSLNPEYSLNKVALIKKYPEGNTIYEYIFPKHTATFEFEPTNEFDPNAIKVMIKGVHVGYVKKGSCARIKNLINQNKIKSISAKIYGGNCKSLYLTVIDLKDDEKISSTDYEFEKQTGDIHITLTLTLVE